jgi:acetylornithine deacetylase/succinyl-diaminopimelate desuccinylase-like protein
MPPVSARARRRGRPWLAGALTLSAAVATGAELSSWDRLARDLLEELVEIDTTDEHGDNTRAAEAMAARLRAAGLPPADVRVLAPAARKGNLVARLRGTGAGRPLLLLAHLDVVEARREDWSVDPFVFREHDGYYWGRGTTDDKAMAAIFVANLIRYRKEGFRPDRDIVVALTADEEGGDHNGVEWLLRAHGPLLEVAYGLNEGGRGLMREGRYLANQLQASEKVYLSFRLEVKSAGGHSSLPVPDNAIYHLAEGLTRLAAFDFPVQLSEVTRAYFERMASVEAGPVGADMRAVTQVPPDPEATARLSRSAFYNAMMRTTCVATRLEAGHADNALPQTARAVVNCRVLPATSAEEVRRTLERVLDDPRITLTAVGDFKPSPPSALEPSLMEAVGAVTQDLWPGVPLVPIMGTGATDSLYLRAAGIPMYGVSGLFGDVDDVRAHGRDERIGVKQFHEGQEFLYRLVKRLTSPGG